MRVIFIIIFVYKIITAENSESKYIDLLPEKEKEEFLETIARRILDEVQAKDDKPKTSGEMSEDQLNQHDAYVQKLLKEEAQNLRKNAGNDTNKDLEPDTSVIGLNKKDINDEDRHVDLTLRTEHGNKKRSRRVFTGFSQNSENVSNQDETNDEESDVDIQVKNIRKNADKTLEVIETTTYTEDNMAGTVTTTSPSLINNDNLSTGENIDDTHNILPDSVNTGQYSDEINVAKTHKDIETTMLSIPDNNPAEIVVTTSTSFTNSNNQNSGKNSKESADTGLLNNLNSIKTTDIFYDTTTSELTAITGEAEIPYNAGSRVVRSYGENIDENVQQDNNNLNADNDTHINVTTDSIQVQDTITTSASERTSKVNSDEMVENSKFINIEIVPTTEKPTFATTEVPSVTQNDKLMNTDPNTTEININIETITARTEELTTISPTSQDTTPKSKDTVALEENNVTTQKNDAKPKLEMVPLYLKEPDKKKVEEMTRKNVLIKMLRQRLVEEGDNLNEPVIKTEVKEYKVYEISPNATPFVKVKSLPTKLNSRQMNSKVQKMATADINKEQPFYVPIYNYAPENAFYNPDNVFGPNNDADVDKDDVKVIKDDEEEKGSNLEKDRYPAIENDSNENLNKFDWDYYFEDRHLRKLRFGSKTDMNSDYDPGQKEESLRQEKKSSGKITSELSTSLFDPNFKYSTDAVRRIRQLLFQTKNWSFIQPVEDRTTTTPKEPKELEKEKSYLMRARSSKKKTNDVDDKDLVEKYLKRKTERGPYFFRYEHKDRNLQVPLRFNADTQTTNKRPILRKKKTKKEARTDYELMKKIIDTVPGSEIMPILQKLQKADLQKTQRSQGVSSELDVYVTVMGDMIKEDNKALKQYNWLETTVDLQSAIKKMIDMTDAIQNQDNLHPSDLQLLKFLINLYNLATEEVRINNIFGEELRNFLPKSRIKNRGIIKESGLLNRVWLVRMLDEEQPIHDENLRDFNAFLHDLQTAFYDLHTAFKYISMVTSYKNQNWLDDLKVLNTDSTRKQILELILHLSTARLLELIEGSAKNGLVDDYLDYVDKNEKEVVRMKEDLVFVMKLLEELKLSAP